MWNLTRCIIYSQLNVLLLEAERMVFSSFTDEEMNQISVSDLCRIAQLAILGAGMRAPDLWHSLFDDIILALYGTEDLKTHGQRQFVLTSYEVTLGLFSSRKAVAVSSSVCVASPDNVLSLAWHLSPSSISQDWNGGETENR